MIDPTTSWYKITSFGFAIYMLVVIITIIIGNLYDKFKYRSRKKDVK